MTTLGNVLGPIGFLGVAAALVTALGCTVSGGDASSTDWTEYDGHGFTMSAPSEWRRTSNQQFQVLFVAPEREGFSANLGISLTPLSPEATVDQVAAAAKKFQSQEYPAYSVLTEGPVSIGGLPAFRRHYQWTNKQRNVEVQQLQAWLKSGTNLYTITATSKAVLFDQSGPSFQRMLSSFKVKAGA